MDNLNKTFTGVFISAELLADKNLTLQEKVLFAMISNLDKGKGCIAQNSYFANILGLSSRRVAGIMEKLEGKGYITRKDTATKRVIKVNEKDEVAPVEEVKEECPVEEVEEVKEEGQACNCNARIAITPEFDDFEMKPVKATFRRSNSIKVVAEPSECYGGQDQFKLDIPAQEVKAEDSTQRLLFAGFTMEQIEAFRSKSI